MALAASSALPPPMPITASNFVPRSSETCISTNCGEGSPATRTCCHVKPRALKSSSSFTPAADSTKARWPVTSSSDLPYCAAIAGSLTMAPQPNSMRGKRAMEKEGIDFVIALPGQRRQG